jgi:hypothetical protein
MMQTLLKFQAQLDTVQAQQQKLATTMSTNFNTIKMDITRAEVNTRTRQLDLIQRCEATADAILKNVNELSQHIHVNYNNQDGHTHPSLSQDIPYSATEYANPIDMAPENQNEKHTAAHHSFKCKPPVFPKYATSGNLDSHFTQLERYFRLSKVPEFAQIDFALLSIPQYANWWDSFTTTRNDSIPITWELFKTTMTTFMTGPSPAHTAMSRLLALKQSTFSADKYSRMFMNLVRQSKTPPTQG